MSSAPAECLVCFELSDSELSKLRTMRPGSVDVTAQRIVREHLRLEELRELRRINRQSIKGRGKR